MLEVFIILIIGSEGIIDLFVMVFTEYLKIEAEARSLAAKFEVENDWKDIKFREANMEDRKMI